MAVRQEDLAYNSSPGLGLFCYRHGSHHPKQPCVTQLDVPPYWLPLTQGVQAG